MLPVSDGCCMGCIRPRITGCGSSEASLPPTRNKLIKYEGNNMTKNRPDEIGFEKLSDEELSRKVKHYETIERIGGFLAIAVIIVLFAAAFLSDNVLLVLALIALAVAIVRLLPMRANGKKNALLTQQLGGYFFGELARMFGSAPEKPEMPIDEAFLRSVNPVRSAWKDCNISNFYEGVCNGMRFSAANVLLSRREMSDHPDDSSSYTIGAFYGVVLRCKAVCDPVTDIILRDRAEFEYSMHLNGTPKHTEYPARKDGGLYNPDAFSHYYSARTSDGNAADDAVTPQLRDLITKLEGFTPNGRVAALSLHGGELTLALHTSYLFAHIPDKQNLQNIDGIRKSYTDSLTTMAVLLDLIRESCAEM